MESKLFHITSDSHNSYNDNNNTNNYQNHNNLIRNFINNLVGEQNTVVFQQEEIGTEFLKDNCIFTKDFLTNDENDNELLEDKIDNDYICQESLNKQSLKDHLLKYYIFCCHQHCLFLNSLFFKNDDDSLSELCLGKINLIDNYFKCKYNNSQNLIYSTAMNMKYYYEYSRYEFIYVSYCLHVLIVGNRQGDIQIYDLELILSNEGELKINNNPLGIIDCNGRIVGFQVVEYNNKHSNNYLEIYVLKLNKILECYKFRRSFC